MMREGEYITLKKSPSSLSGINGRIRRSEPVTAGGWFEKQFITLEAGSHTLHLVIKNTTASEVFASYQALREAGIPVIDSLRVVDANHVAMTDLREEKVVLFGRSMRESLSHPSSERTAAKTLTPDAISTFMAATQDESTLREELNRYAEIATERGIYFPDDEVFEFVIYPDGRTKWMLLDLDRVEVGDQRYENPRRIRNLDCVNRTMKNIKSLRKTFEKGTHKLQE